METSGHSLSNRDIILKLLFMVVAIKLALFLFAYFSFDFKVHSWEDASSIWSRWDSRAYVTIATQGYAPAFEPEDYKSFLSHFPPLYPLLMGFMYGVFNIPIDYSGIMLSVSASIAASYFLFKLVLMDFNDVRTAFLSVIFMNLYPLSYFTLAVYSDSLFLLLVILSFYLMRKERHYWAGLAGAGAMLARITGLNLIPTYLFSILMKLRKKQFKLEMLAPVVFVSLGFGTYLLINHFYFGSFRYFYDESLSFNWTKELVYPMKEASMNLWQVTRHPHISFGDNYFLWAKGYNSIFTFITLVLIIWGFIKKLPGDYTVYSASSLLFFSSFSWGISDARYSLSIFPIFVSLALIKNNFVKYLIMAVSAVMLCYFTRVFTGGSWAF